MCAVCTELLSRVRLFVTPWTVAPQAPRPGDFLGMNTGVGCHCPPPGHLSNPGIKPRSPAFQEDSLPSEPTGKPIAREDHLNVFKSP